MKRQIVLAISLVAGLAAALLTRGYLTVKENEIKAEKERLLKKYGTIDVLAFRHDVPSGSVLSRLSGSTMFSFTLSTGMRL